MPKAPRPLGTQPPLVRVPRVRPPWELDGLGDIPALVDVLGGNATVVAFYDVRTGVTDAGGVASQWADARGASGYGPALTAAGAARPAWDGSMLTFDGIDDTMATSTSALFVLSGAYSLVMIAALPQTVAVSYAATIADSVTLTRFLAVSQQAGGAGFIRGEGRAVAVSTVAVSATRRVSIASKNGTTDVSIDVPNTARVSAVATAEAAGNNALTVGASFVGGTGFNKAVVRAVLCLNKQVSPADVTAIFAWARDNHGAVAA